MLSDWLTFMVERPLIGVQVQRQGPGGAAKEDEHALHPERPEPPHLLRLRRLLPSVGAAATPPERRRNAATPLPPERRLRAATALPPEHSRRHTRQLHSSSTPAATASATGIFGTENTEVQFEFLFLFLIKSRFPWGRNFCNFLV
jgi:hypothetical protein